MNPDPKQAHPFETTVARLRAAGSVFAEDEARLLGGDEALIARRIAGERLEHVLGWSEFSGLRIAVDPGVFIPRPQTEALAEHAASLKPALALDLFAGSAAIACVVKARNPGARVVAAELDPVALACARRNGERFGVEVVAADVDEGVPTDLEGRVDVLTANVPYVPRGELPFVPHEGEPATALDGGSDGLDWVRRVAAIAPRWLRPGGVLLIERPEDATPIPLPGFRVSAPSERVLSAQLPGNPLSPP
ncbi:MAG TPA: methyltransferase [Thermoleophilaceae bacterium]|nr:methyltransferase [Thermoleophilaceae bacterium]